MTISANTDFSTILGDFRITYKDDLADNRPLFTVLQELLKPDNNWGVGEKLRIPVILTQQGGESYQPSGSSDVLRNPVSMEIKDAEIDQYEVTQTVRIPFGVLSKASQGPKARFADPIRLRVLSGQTGAKRALELSLLHGCNGLGQVASVAAVVGAAAPFTRAVTFTAQSWSDGIWAATENLPFDFYSALVGGTKRNAGDVNVLSVDFAAKTVTFTTSATGLATDLSGIVAGDFIFPASASAATQAPGLMNIISSNAATLFNLPTTYSMWKSKRVDVGGVPMTFNKLTSGISPAVSAGADGKLTALVNPRNWTDLERDLLTVRRIDASYSSDRLRNGTKALFYSYPGGDIQVVIHPYMKDGEAVVFPTDNWYRVGSDPDPTMDLAGNRLQAMSQVANTFDFRWFAANALVPDNLSTSVYFFNITPNPP